MTMELPLSDFGSLSTALKLVDLPTVLGSLQNDTLLVWNSAFQKRVGLSEDELARTPLTALLTLQENAGELLPRGRQAGDDNPLVPCVLKNPVQNAPGLALRLRDGMFLAMLDDTVGDIVRKGFMQGRRAGCEEERNRTRRFFHNVLSSKILVASFLAHEIYQRLAASEAEATEDMAKLTKLLREAIEAIVQGAE
jgi:hypothetical protein